MLIPSGSDLLKDLQEEGYHTILFRVFHHQLSVFYIYISLLSFLIFKTDDDRNYVDDDDAGSDLKNDDVHLFVSRSDFDITRRDHHYNHHVIICSSSSATSRFTSVQ